MGRGTSCGVRGAVLNLLVGGTAPSGLASVSSRMGITSWDLDGGFSTPARTQSTPNRPFFVYSDPTGPHVLSPSYGILEAREAHDWFLCMMREHEEFEVETDQPGELPMPLSSETVRWVVVE